MADSKPPTTVEEFRRFAEWRYGDLAGDFLEAYPVTDDTDVREVFVASVGDAWFTWQMRMWARLTATVDANAWLYHFTRVPPIPQSDIYGPPRSRDRLCLRQFPPRVLFPQNEGC